jgi:bacterioferritin-associated ferredoxin
MYICICNAISERHIETAVSNGAETVEDLQRQLALGSQCGSCQTCAKECLSRIHQQHSASQAVTPCFI